ncbi:MAG: acetylxylan esterase [Chloroflexi bacterium]|nr:acetylxylan esterase [Chloroflexota bacterium]
MAERNFSMVEYFNRRAKDWRPELSFDGAGDTLTDWKRWQSAASDKLNELLGAYPLPVDMNAEVEYSVQRNGLIRERVVFDSEEGMSVPCTLLKLPTVDGDGSTPAILCCHGHGPYGKEPVVGNTSSEGLRASIALHNYNYAEQMALRGFVTLSPDLRGFGERSDGGSPYTGKDPCNVHFIRGVIMGIYTLTLNVWDMMRCVDYLRSRPEVDADRIGMMGLSLGGTATAFTAAVEPRIKAADIIGYVNPWETFGIRNANFCGSQIVPEVYRYLDTSDIAGLIAPRPLLLEMGEADTTFPIEDQLKGYEAVKQIYAAAGASERLWADIHPGGHAFAGNKAFAFFEKFL